VKRIKQTAHYLIACAIVFVFGCGIGVVGRITDCRSDMRTIHATAPGDTAGPKLYDIEVTACALPEQWGGRKAPLEDYP
jgi:predicted RNA-binding protein with PUA domain